MEMEQEKVNGKASVVVSDSVSRKYKEDNDAGVSLNSFFKASPFLSADGEEEDEMIIKPQFKSLPKNWNNGEVSCKPKTKVAPSAREQFEECFAKWQKFANSDKDATAEELYLSGKQDKIAATAAAKRELTGKFKELSPDLICKARKMAESPSIPSPTPPLRRNSDRHMFEVRVEDPPVMSSRKQEAKFNVRMDFLGDSLIRWASFNRFNNYFFNVMSLFIQKKFKRLKNLSFQFIRYFS